MPTLSLAEFGLEVFLRGEEDRFWQARKRKPTIGYASTDQSKARGQRLRDKDLEAAVLSKYFLLETV